MFFKISKAKIPIKWESLKVFTLDYKNIELDSPKINLWIKNKTISNLFINQVTNWLNEDTEFSISIKDALITVIFDTKGYQKEMWNIENVSGNIHNLLNEKELSIFYSNKDWGAGKININPNECSNQCKWFFGEYKWEFSSFSAEKLSWIIKPFIFTEGEINGKINFLFNKDNKEIWETFGQIEANNIKIQDDEERLLLNEISLNTSYKIDHNTKGQTIKLKGKLNGGNYDLSYNQDKNELWPNNAEFKISDFEQKGFFVLPYGFKIYGLKQMTVSINKPLSSASYRNIDSNIEISNGQFLDNNKILFFIPNLNLIMNSNDYELNLLIHKNKSDIGINMHGKITLFSHYFSEIIRDMKTLDKKVVSKEIIGISGKHQGHLNSKKFLFNDFFELKSYLIDKWKKSVLIGINNGWRESKLREREWFITLLWKNLLSMPINIENFSLENTQSSKMTGNLSISNNLIDFNLKEYEGRENYLDLLYNFNSNYPTISGNLSLDLQDASNIRKDFIGDDIINSLKAFKYVWNFKSGGERPVDLYNTFRGKGVFEFYDVVLGKYFDDKEVDKNWNFIKGEASAYYNSGYFNNTYGQNQNNNLYTYGRWKTDNFFKEWKITHNIRPKTID
ncbi:MAG: hypothetical protein OEZ13_01330 [Spirochaetia bacterium]|nr:hypothetical protein [Spirochaetia bacterium]